MEKLKVFEAFSGVGTQHMALKNIDIPFEVVAIADIDEPAIRTYRAIHGEVNNLGDISKIDSAVIPDHDLFTYSFPCQDVSLDGFLKGLSEEDTTRSSLLWECKKVIEAKKPKFLLLENVKNLVSKRFKHDFDKWLEWLESQGYSNHWKVVNAKGFSNIPQNRERVFVVSMLEDNGFEFPADIPLTNKLMDYIESDVDESLYLSEDYLDQLIYKKGDLPLLPTQRAFVANNSTGHIIADVGDCFVYNYPTSKTRRGRVGKQVAQTLQTSLNMGVVMPDLRIKKLSTLEYWRLMGIADVDYYKAVEAGATKGDLYRQAGNAIVVDVLERIFTAMFK